ncbi:hypothetical protein JJQ05_24470, partial [Enterobacter cloacae]|nr:hypothetical protein [Enterobacter cloacae]
IFKNPVLFNAIFAQPVWVLGGGWSPDFDNIIVKLQLSGKIAFVLGVGGDINIQLGPFTDVPIQERLGFVSSKSGVVLSGESTVIIGG